MTMAKNRITIRDLAGLSDVSTATVSRYIHRNGYVSKENAAKIERAIAQTGYNSSQTSSASASVNVIKNSNVIAVVATPSKRHTFLPRLTYALAISAEAHGFHTMNIAMQPSNNSIQQIINICMSENVCGIIIADFQGRELSSDNKELLLHCGAPVVMVERGLCSELNSVKIDTKHGIYMSTKHLIETGRKNIHYFTAPLSSKVEEDRLAGFKEALAEEGNYSESAVHICDSMDADSCYSCLEQVFSKKDIPDGIVTWSDVYAVTALRFMYDHKISVPSEAAIIGYDDFLAPYAVPPLSSIHTPIEEMADSTINLIRHDLESSEFYAQTVSFSPKLILRQTT